MCLSAALFFLSFATFLEFKRFCYLSLLYNFNKQTIMSSHFKYLVILLFFTYNIGSSQRNPNCNVVGVQQLDSRFNFSIEKYWSGLADAESYYFYVKNNTADEYLLVIEVDLTLNCYDSGPYKLGYIGTVYLKPYGEFTPKDDNVHNYMITSDREKQKSCLVKIGNTATLYRSHTWQIKSIVNLTQKKANEAKAKSEQEALRLQKIENQKKEQLKAKEQADNKRKIDTENKNKASSSAGSNKQTGNTSSTSAGKTTAGNSSEKSKASVGSGTNSKSTANLQAEAAENKQQIENEVALKREQEKQERLAEEARLREEEERKAQARQLEYDTWKVAAQKEQDQQDILNATATFSMFTLLGGIIYDGMGDVDPAFVYQSPIKKFQPKLFVNFDFGFSFSAEPILFQSSFSTMTNGNSTTVNSLKGDDGYYLNVNVESRVGAGNDFYSFYGLIAGKFGVVPTFNGSRFSFEYGGGADVGIKNVKLFGQYRGALMDEKSLSSSDVEENGSGDLDALSSEISYGLKFTFGGDKDDNYRRSHISIGAIKRQYDLSGTTYFYDDDSKSVKNANINPIEGYLFEWRKDHTFRLFARFYENFNYIGTVEGVKSVNSSLSGTSSFFEIGFLRALDFF